MQLLFLLVWVWKQTFRIFQISKIVQILFYSTLIKKTNTLNKYWFKKWMDKCDQLVILGRQKIVLVLNIIIIILLTYEQRQWAAVRMKLEFRMVPPQKCPPSLVMLTSHGNSCGDAFSPPTIRAKGFLSSRPSPQATSATDSTFSLLRFIFTFQPVNIINLQLLPNHGCSKWYNLYLVRQNSSSVTHHLYFNLSIS